MSDCNDDPSLSLRAMADHDGLGSARLAAISTIRAAELVT